MIYRDGFSPEDIDCGCLEGKLPNSTIGGL